MDIELKFKVGDIVWYTPSTRLCVPSKAKIVSILSHSNELSNYVIKCLDDPTKLVGISVRQTSLIKCEE